jgi:hypothetical protein
MKGCKIPRSSSYLYWRSHSGWARRVPKLTFKFTTIDIPGAVQTLAAAGINNSGVIVGSYADHNSLSHCFMLWGDWMS